MEIYCKEVQPADTHRALYNPAHPCTSRRPIRHITQDEGETPELTMRPVSVLLLVSLIAAVILINVRAKPCPENQKYSRCSGKKECQMNCTLTPKPCTKECVPGCVCVDGYVLLSDQDRRCIPREECPKQ
ncbi:venom serine protease inhibitor-like isoform X3 [Eleutherodactylus coqui]|uniref:venom serine protease inhibitor-like isoform X3 n=1 Tax=Eleutherodactylus coqui TaxID=57060 RepID=UPI0034621661